ncbi:MAG: outer membrane protein assembly factor BamB family protein [Anaerolineae bacterium]
MTRRLSSWTGIVIVALFGLLVGASLLTPIGGVSQAEAPPATPEVAAEQEEDAPQVYLPIIRRAESGSGGGDDTTDWPQHAHDAQHTSYTPYTVPTPWRWKWAWNGPDENGGVRAGKFRLPRNSQPVTGGNRVYIAAGSQGVYALSQRDGSQIWNVNPGGAAINSTPAYDAKGDVLLVLSTNGTLYRLNAATGATLGQFAGGTGSALPLPPALAGDRVYFASGKSVYAVDRTTLNQVWRYDAGSPVDAPPAYSASFNRVIVASRDLYVHAVDAASGARQWRVKPTVRGPGDPDGDTNYAEVQYGWPVIAEGHGLVLVKLRLDWQTMWTWSPWPTDNDQMRANLVARPNQQALMVLRLQDGATAFVANIGHGGFGDGNYMPMGPQPVIRRFADGSEIAYAVIRGGCKQQPCDGRGDSHLGELMLDGTTVPGYQAGYVRFMKNTFFPTDEQPQLSAAGDMIFGGHWMVGLAHRIVDRSPERGSFANPIETDDLPHIVNSASNCGLSAGHYCPGGLRQDGDGREFPAGFYIYYNQGTVYDRFWSEYAAWVVGNNTVYFVSTDGAVVALEHGQPQSAGAAATGLITPAAGALTSPDWESAPAIRPEQARDYAGQAVVVTGRLASVFNNGKAVYLGFKDPHRGTLVVRILAADWGAFAAPPETLYQPGMVIRVQGVVGWYQGDLEIRVRAPGQIAVVAAE